ncbi:Protein of unknown function [Pseudooceanicola antarcticus]|uniref:DUF805 domain-containing protein n=1 Tax=Pseudooceanicola antarcticus TaxID=1247613 RepID=A0A285IKA6_9RHOB|nr:DUF805 domain-containing protein [Pseudooceanicola antarcticus]PJE28732.1 DUF805 domain-containing protein [Pseudooceanicola antarcticus]SNY48394.1 Protein of unknown function [Pseudooceanicola antarcticus]
MSFSDAVRACFRKYVTFSGRASRPEYWYFILFGFLGGLVLGAISDALSSLFSLALFLPTLSAGWRRMHDTGRSGLYLLYPIIAVLGTMSYAAFIGGLSFDTMMADGLADQFDGLAGLILALAVLVCALSPLIVIFWLTRPTQPASNHWGPVPTRRAAA